MVCHNPTLLLITNSSCILQKIDMHHVHTHGMWTHTTCHIVFWLVADDIGITHPTAPAPTPTPTTSYTPLMNSMKSLHTGPSHFTLACQSTGIMSMSLSIYQCLAMLSRPSSASSTAPLGAPTILHLPGPNHTMGNIHNSCRPLISQPFSFHQNSHGYRKSWARSFDVSMPLIASY
jgi:hypothetical protein